MNDTTPEIWTPYVLGSYKKTWYDIKTKSLEIERDCWPNAGFFYPTDGGSAIPEEEVLSVIEKEDPWWA